MSELTEISWNTTAPPSVFYTYQEEQLIFQYFLFGMIVLGNTLVIIALSMTKTRKSRMHLFILNLAIADLSCGLISVLTDIIWKNTIEWKAGDFGCKVVRFSQIVVTYAPTYALVVLSLDRLNAIARPLSFSGDKIRTRLLLSLCWGLAVIFSVPMLFISELQFQEGKYQCNINFTAPWMWKFYMSSIAVILFFIPAIIIAICYIIIVIIIWRKSGQESLTSSNTTATHSTENGNRLYVSSNNARFRESASSSRGVIPRAKMKTIKMTLVIVLVFVICWSPYFVFDLLQVYGYIEMKSQEIMGVSAFIQSLAPLNSAANPMIFAAFNTKMCVNLFRCQNRKHLRRYHNNGSPLTTSCSPRTKTSRRLVNETSFCEKESQRFN